MWVSPSPDCWQEIDGSNVTGTQTHSTPPPGGRSSWLLRNMLAVSDCVCFVGRLTECQGSWGVAVWMTGQQGSAGDLPAQAKRSTFPSTMGCSFGFSPSLPSVYNYPMCCLIWESTQMGVKPLENGEILLSETQEWTVSSVPQVLELFFFKAAGIWGDFLGDENLLHLQWSNVYMGIWICQNPSDIYLICLYFVGCQ